MMNVLVICVDTLRWDHCGYTKKKPVFTPNIDRLAQRSTVFDRAFISSFPTNPMRTDCITGNCNFPRYDWKNLGDDEVVLSEVLRDAGYYTALIVDHGPMAGLNRGFDEFSLTHTPPEDAPKAEDMPFPVPKTHIRGEGKQRQQQMAELAHCKYDSQFWVGTSMTKAAEWLQENCKRDKWFLWVDTFEPHEVWHTPQYYVDMYDPNYEGPDYDFPNYGYTDIYTKRQLKHLWAHYAANVTMTDRWIGHLLTQMDVMNLWDTTMVVLVSDHGTYIGEHGRTGKHTVAGPKDPWPLYEEVAHIPLLVWIPRRRVKKRVKALSWVPDIMPTILDACRVKKPEMYGKSLLPLMTEKKRKNWEIVYSSKHDAPGMRVSLVPTRMTATTDRWSYIARKNDNGGMKPELYDLRSDPSQRRNLARQYPEIAEKLQQRCVKFLQEQGATEEYVANLT